MSSDVSFEHGGELEKLRRLGISIDGLIDFSVNVNPLAPPEELVRMLKDRVFEVTRYPEPGSGTLVSKLSAKLDVPPNGLVISNGSNQLIYAVCRALKPRRVLVVQPTFSEYERSARLNGAEVIELILKVEDGFSVPLDDLLKRVGSSDLVFICNPNNPTGTAFERELLIELMGRFSDTTFVIDEVFLELSDVERSFVKDTLRFDNLVVLRSFTKLFSIPGLRLGYSVSSQRIAAILTAQIERWSVNRLAQIAGEVILEMDGFVEMSRSFICSERAFLFSEISKIEGFTPFPSHANFLLVRSDHLRSGSLQMKLLEKGIFIRNCSNFKGLDDRFFRVAVRRREENLRLISALREVAGCGPDV
ncbi:threonine-phosphate decarboxylase [Candidatus Poribacteria bacterium]|nr:threonine-phosphate decarboxylase [Candidatus Poribacteria bacterium]